MLKNPANPASKLSAWLLSKGFINPALVDISDYREYWQNGDLRKDFSRYISALLIRDAYK